jgi:glycosyltransferase 2 family protein
MTRPSVKRLIKILLSVVFLGLIARSLHAQNPWEYLVRVRPAWALASLCVTLAMVSVSCWKWKVLLQLELAPVPFHRLFRFYLIGYYYTVLLPSNVGGDVMRAYLAGRDTGGHARSVASVFLERVTGLFVLLILAATMPLLVPGLIQRPIVLVPVLLAGGLLVALIAGVALPAPGRWMPRLFSRVVPGWHAETPRGWLARAAARLVRVLDKVRGGILSAVAELRGRPGGMVAVVALTLLFYALTWVNVLVSFRAFGVEVPLVSAMAVVPVCMVIACLPVAPFAGLGLTEGAYIVFFGLVDVPRAASLAMAVLLRLKLLGLGFAGMICQIPGTRRPEPEARSLHE